MGTRLIKYCKCGKQNKRLKKGLCPSCYIRQFRKDNPEYYANEKKKEKIRYYTKVGNTEKVDELNRRQCKCGNKIYGNNSICGGCEKRAQEDIANKVNVVDKSIPIYSPAKISPPNKDAQEANRRR